MVARSRSTKVWALAALTLLITSCSGLLKAPKVELESLAVETLTGHELHLKATLKLTNPNGIALKIRKVEYEALVNQRPVAQQTIRQAISIDAHGETTTTLPLRLKTTQVLNSMFDLLRNQKATYQISGRIFGDGITQVPFSANGEFEIPILR